MQTTLVLSVVVPTLIAIVVLSVGYQVWRSQAVEGDWSMAVAPPICALAAYAVVREFPSVPPADAGVWPVWLALITALATTFVRRGASPVIRLAITLVAALTTAWLVSAPLLAHAWSGGQAVLWIAGATVAVTVAALALDHRAATVPGAGVPVALAGLAGATAAMLGSSGTALLAQTAAGAAAALGVAAVVAVVRRPHLSARAAVGPTVVLLGGFMLAGLHYAETNMTGVVLMLAAALAIGLAPLPGLAAGGIRAAITLGTATAVVTGAAVGGSMIFATNSAADKADTTEDDDYGYD